MKLRDEAITLKKKKTKERKVVNVCYTTYVFILSVQRQDQRKTKKCKHKTVTGFRYQVQSLGTWSIWWLTLILKRHRQDHSGHLASTVGCQLIIRSHLLFIQRTLISAPTQSKRLMTSHSFLCFPSASWHIATDFDKVSLIYQLDCLFWNTVEQKLFHCNGQTLISKILTWKKHLAKIRLGQRISQLIQIFNMSCIQQVKN